MGVIDGDGTTVGHTSGQIACYGKQSLLGLLDLMLDNNWYFHEWRDNRNPENYTIYYNYENESPRPIPACDDFAAALAGSFARFPQWSGFPVAAIWGSFHGGHAFCTAVAWPSLEDRTPAIYYIEPQSDWEIAPEHVEGTDLWLLRI